MINKFYKILWIDDEHEKKLSGLKAEAKLNGIELISFKSLDGLDELERNYQVYDGVLLDAKFYKNEDDKSGTENLKYLKEAHQRISQLPKKFDPFVLTGQARLFNDETFNLLFPNYYRKGIKDDIEQLFADIKRRADVQIETQIKHEYHDIFEIFSSGYLTSDIEGQVMDLIKSPLPKTRAELKGILTNIRSIQESCLVALEKIEVIPDSASSFNDIIRHLSGNKDPKDDYMATSHEYQNDAIENLHKWVYFTCGMYIHHLKDANYSGYSISNYAIESLRKGILELLLWFKQTYKNRSINS